MEWRLDCVLALGPCGNHVHKKAGKHIGPEGMAEIVDKVGSLNHNHKRSKKRNVGDGAMDKPNKYAVAQLFLNPESA